MQHITAIKKFKRIVTQTSQDFFGRLHRTYSCHAIRITHLKRLCELFFMSFTHDLLDIRILGAYLRIALSACLYIKSLCDKSTN